MGRYLLYLLYKYLFTPTSRWLRVPRAPPTSGRECTPAKVDALHTWMKAYTILAHRCIWLMTRLPLLLYLYLPLVRMNFTDISLVTMKTKMKDFSVSSVYRRWRYCCFSQSSLVYQVGTRTNIRIIHYYYYCNRFPIEFFSYKFDFSFTHNDPYVKRWFNSILRVNGMWSPTPQLSWKLSCMGHSATISGLVIRDASN